MAPYEGFTRFAALLLFVTALAAPALAADKYITNLGPMPLDDATRVNIQGRGDASGVLDGKTLTISGTFGKLPSPATAAHLNLSAATGMPGTKIADLTVTQAASGTVSGNITLTAKQVTAFRTGKLYIQIDSQKAPDGTVWGWLLPDHEIVGANVPQADRWFIPQLDTPSR
jgi:CHRD domain